MRRGLILVEGQTEDEFVRSVLQPYLSLKTDLYLVPTIVVTKVVKAGPNFKGGLSRYEPVRGDIAKLLQDSAAIVITTLFDYYGLPDDFPGMLTRPGRPVAAFAKQRVDHVQSALRAEFNDRRFAPFFALHEFETWLYCDLSARMEWVYQGGDISQLRAARLQVTSPEEINENYATAPSRRITTACPNYQKTLHGPLAMMDIGLDPARLQCAHLNEWLTFLEGI